MARELKVNVSVNVEQPEPDEALEPLDYQVDLNPELGLIVHYVLPFGPQKGEHRAAIVTRVWQPLDHPITPGMVNLQVFQDQSNDFDDGEYQPRWVGSILYDPKGTPGTWHWPEPIGQPEN